LPVISETVTDVVLKASKWGRGDLDAVFSAGWNSHGLVSVLSRCQPYCLGFYSASLFVLQSWLGVEGSVLYQFGSN